MAQNQDFVCGDHIGPWLIAEKIGSGSFGKIYKCINDLGTTAAQKVMSNLPVARHEMSMMRQLTGITEVPHLFNAWFEYDYCYLTMEIVGPNLWELRLTSPDNRFNVDTLQKVAYQSIKAVEEIHKRGIIHGDLMGPNVCISHPPNLNGEVTIKVIDFGSAWNRQTGEMIKMDWNHDRKASPFLLNGKGPIETDDLNQWLYTILFFAGHQLDEIFHSGSLEEGNTFKIQLVNDPRSVVDKEYQWLYYLMKLVGKQSKEKTIDYYDIREAIEWFGPTDYSLQPLKMIKIDGLLTLL